jgi:hypothetical protein
MNAGLSPSFVAYTHVVGPHTFHTSKAEVCPVPGVEEVKVNFPGG